MKINYIHNIAFQKTLCATAGILKDEKSEQCNIYKLDSKNDRDYFSKLQQDKNWKNNHWVRNIDGTIQNITSYPNVNIYVLENKKEKCLGYMLVAEKNYSFKEQDKQMYDYNEIMLFETAPSLQNNKSYRYIGETLFTFLCKLAEKMKKSNIALVSTTSAIEFYTKCNCTSLSDMMLNFMYIEKENFKKQIEQNEKHVGIKINLIQ